jgi:hypothetical protein
MGKQVGGKFQSWILKTNLPTIRVSNTISASAIFLEMEEAIYLSRARCLPLPFYLPLPLGKDACKKGRGKRPSTTTMINFMFNV